MNSHADSRAVRTGDGKDKQVFMGYPVASDIMRSGKWLAGKYVIPEYRTTVPKNVQLLAMMQDYDTEIPENMTSKQVGRPADPGEVLIHSSDTTNYYYPSDKIDLEFDFDSARNVAALFSEGWVQDEDLSMYWDHGYEVFRNEWTKEARIVFDHFHFDENVTDFESFSAAMKDPTSDAALTLRNITFNNESAIRKHPFWSDGAAASIREAVDALKSEDLDVKFSGYSLGGYRAKYWGSLLNIDQDVINAHVTPWNTFGETTAKTTFHTISTDETNLKYKFPDFKGNLANDEHYTYPPSSSVEPLNLAEGNLWGHHLKESFYADDLDVAYGRDSWRAIDGVKIGAGIQNASNALAMGVSAYSAYQDFKQGNPVMGVADSGVAATALGEITGKLAEGSTGAVAPIVGAVMYGEKAYDAARAGKTGTAVFKGAESATTVGAAAGGLYSGGLAGAGMAGGAAIEVLGGIDNAMNTYQDIRNKEYDHAAAHGIESASLTAGGIGGVMALSGALAPETGGASVLIGGIVAGIAEISDAVGKYRYRKRRAAEDRRLAEEDERAREKQHAEFFKDPSIGKGEYRLPSGYRWVMVGDTVKAVKDDYKVSDVSETTARPPSTVQTSHDHASERFSSIDWSAPVHGNHATA